MIACEHIKQQTGFGVWLTVQNISGLVQNFRTRTRAAAHDFAQSLGQRCIQRCNRNIFDMITRHVITHPFDD